MTRQHLLGILLIILAFFCVAVMSAFGKATSGVSTAIVSCFQSFICSCYFGSCGRAWRTCGRTNCRCKSPGPSLGSFHALLLGGEVNDADQCRPPCQRRTTVVLVASARFAPQTDLRQLSKRWQCPRRRGAWVSKVSAF